jgi:CPA1 family monovalent cation:H+ antiporter
MHLLEVVLFLMLCAVALGWVARRLEFPYPIALVLGGALLGFVPGLPSFPLDPAFILVLVLPPILYQAALLTSWRDFKANLREIGLLAIGLVIVTTLAVGASLKFLVPACPWSVAFVFGAIVSPPDAVAATAVLSRLNIPRRVVTVLEGESLVNDASGLVLYKFAVAAVLTGAFSFVEAGTQFAVMAVGGIGIGSAIAMASVFIHRRLGDAFIEVLTAIAIPWVAYIFAESLHTSGVLAVVAAGLVRGRHAPAIVSAEMRILARSTWNILVFLLNSLIFILIGIQLSQIIGRIENVSIGEVVAKGLLVSVVTIAVRFAWIFPAETVARLFRRGARRVPASERAIMSWCGMRGIVSLAAALALPVALPDGSPFPHRDLLIFFTFIVIAVTLVLQGLTLAPLIRWLKVGTDWSAREEETHARQALSEAAVTAIESVAAEENAPADLVARLRAEFSDDIAAATTMPGDPRADLARRLRRAAIRAERQALLHLWRQQHIGDEVLHHLEEVLDYKEARL